MWAKNTLDTLANMPSEWFKKRAEEPAACKDFRVRVNDDLPLPETHHWQTDQCWHRRETFDLSRWFSLDVTCTLLSNSDAIAETASARP